MERTMVVRLACLMKLGFISAKMIISTTTPAKAVTTDATPGLDRKPFFFCIAIASSF